MSQQPAAPQSIDQLLRLGADAARNGNRPAARSLFLALAREHPHDARVWLALASVAASRNEQREALERVVALDPGHDRARAALERLNAAAETIPAGRVTPVLAERGPPAVGTEAPWAARAGVEPSRPAHDEDERRGQFPLLNALALGVILLLLAALGVLLGRALLGEGAPAVATATPALAVQPDAAATAPAAIATATAVDAATAAAPAALPTAAASPTLSPAGSPTPPLLASPTTPAAGAAPSPQPAESLVLPMGVPIEVDGWAAVLVRPDDAVPLDGAIGDLQPSGRFVLTVVAVSNNSPTPRLIPADLFVLVDAAGRSYTPVPGASTAYLALYERAQRGDLALEDLFDPVVGLRSVPLIFDVPPDAAGLRLTVNGAGPAGWPVGEGAPAPAPSGP